MIEIGVSEAKARFSWLIDKVIRGEEVSITRHGRPVARLVPDEQAVRATVENAIKELQHLRPGLKLERLSWEDLRDAGR